MFTETEIKFCFREKFQFSKVKFVEDPSPSMNSMHNSNEVSTELTI